MSESNCRVPIVARFYRQYLSDEDAARFIKAVSERYTSATLERLALFGSPLVRRSAMLALGFVATYESNVVLAQGLHDSDRGVRVLAEDGIRGLWERAGSEEQRQRLMELLASMGHQEVRTVHPYDTLSSLFMRIIESERRRTDTREQPDSHVSGK